MVALMTNPVKKPPSARQTAFEITRGALASGVCGALFGACCGAILAIDTGSPATALNLAVWLGACGVVSGTLILSALRGLDPIGFSDLFQTVTGPREVHASTSPADDYRNLEWFNDGHWLGSPDFTGSRQAVILRMESRHGTSL